MLLTPLLPIPVGRRTDDEDDERPKSTRIHDVESGVAEMNETTNSELDWTGLVPKPSHPLT